MKNTKTIVALVAVIAMLCGTLVQAENIWKSTNEPFSESVPADGWVGVTYGTGSLLDIEWDFSAGSGRLANFYSDLVEGTTANITATTKVTNTATIADFWSTKSALGVMNTYTGDGTISNFWLQVGTIDPQSSAPDHKFGSDVGFVTLTDASVKIDGGAEVSRPTSGWVKDGWVKDTTNFGVSVSASGRLESLFMEGGTTKNDGTIGEMTLSGGAYSGAGLVESLFMYGGTADNTGTISDLQLRGGTFNNEGTVSSLTYTAGDLTGKGKVGSLFFEEGSEQFIINEDNFTANSRVNLANANLVWNLWGGLDDILEIGTFAWDSIFYPMNSNNITGLDAIVGFTINLDNGDLILSNVAPTQVGNQWITLALSADGVSVSATAVPEPATLAILGLGLAGLGLGARRRRK